MKKEEIGKERGRVGSNTIWVHNLPQKTMVVFDDLALMSSDKIFILTSKTQRETDHASLDCGAGSVESGETSSLVFIISHLKLIGLACSLTADT